MIDTSKVNIVRRDGHGDVFEWLAVLSGEDYRSIPTSICPVVLNVVAHYGGAIADDDFRTAEMTRLLPRLLGTLSTNAVQQRRWHHVLSWYDLEYMPTLFRACGLHADAWSFYCSNWSVSDTVYGWPLVGVSTAAQRCLTNAALVYGSAGSYEECMELAPQCLSTVRHYLTEATPAEAQTMYASISALIDRVLL